MGCERRVFLNTYLLEAFGSEHWDKRCHGTKGIRLDNKAFLDSAVPERPSCIVPAAARHRFGSPARQQAGWLCDVDGTVPEKEFLARRDKKSTVQLRTGTCENTMRVLNMCLDQNFSVLCKYPKNSGSKQANLFGLNYAQLINNLNLIRW